MTLWLAFVVASALGASVPEVKLYFPDGEPIVGAPGDVEVAVAVDGRPRESATVELAAELGKVGIGAPVGLGRWRWPYTAPEVRDTLRVRVDGGEWSAITTTPSAAPRGRVSAAASVEEAVGSDFVLHFPLAAPVAANELVVRTSEGTVQSVEVDAQEVRVRVMPGPDRGARVVAVGVSDRGQPGASVVFGIARLRARQSAALNVGLGSTVQIKVGRRSYGPFLADSTGVAHVSFDVLPGETRFDIVASDDLGNSQKVQSPLPANLAPVLVGVDLAVGRLAGARVTLGVWTAAGGVWTGAAPSCRGPVGDELAVRPLGGGVWQFDAASAPGSAAFDLRVDCAVAETAARFRIPLTEVRPARVEVRAYPDTLSTDFPSAQVQALLLDEQGDHLPVYGLTLSAQSGQVETTSDMGALRADYRGEAAVVFGKDTLSAEWRAPPGSGAVWDLDLIGAAVSAGIEVRARALDVAGRPLQGVVIEGDVDGAPWSTVSGANGWGAAFVSRPPGALWLARAHTGSVARAAAIFAAGPGQLPSLQAPDLAATLVLPIQAGRVRRVQLDVAPRPLVIGTGEQGLITVRMFDARGAPVRDEPVTVTATAGTVVQGVPRPDGSIEAVYTPPTGSQARTVTITAATASSTVDTRLELVPRPVSGSLGLDVGWLTNFGPISSPSISLAAENKLPFLPDSVAEVVRGRLSVSTHALRADLVDPATGLAVEVKSRFIPITLGAVAESRTARRTLEFGVSAVLAAYQLSVDYDGAQGVSGSGFTPPGIQVHAGGGFRMGISEIYAEGRYLILNAPAGPVTFEGSVGGVSLSAGYRVLY